MKKSAIIFAGAAAVAAVVAKSVAHAEKEKSAKSLGTRVDLLTKPSFAAKQFAERIKGPCGDKANAVKVMYPFARDIFTLGYTLGRRDELADKYIDADEHNRLINSFLNNSI